MIYNFLRFPGGKPKVLTLSYDDGSKFDIRFLEIIEKYNLKCTFNLIGSRVKKETDLSIDFIKENIVKKGHEIANHGFYHRAQDTLRPVEAICDLLDCKRYFEKEFGVIVRGMAFPDRSVNKFIKPEEYKKLKSYVSDLDIAYIRTTGADNDNFLLPEDWHNWFATAHHDNPKIMEYIDKFLNLDLSKQYIANRYPRLFTLWGHSFEFEHKNNWQHLKKICQKLSNNEDVWYATNIDIYNYVNAYKSLIYSADGEIVFNPTVYDIWLDTDGKTYCVHSGETKCL